MRDNNLLLKLCGPLLVFGNFLGREHVRIRNSHRAARLRFVGYSGSY
jgi:hypothetical protein